MKKKLTLVTFAAAFAAMFGMNLDMAAAQFGGAGARLGSQVQEPESFRRVAADLNVGLPGRVWISTNFADDGLGYNGSYFTLGGKTRLFEDFLDGRWLGEARVHQSFEEDGGFFANVGIERVFSIKAAEAEVVTGFWYDFDGDQQGNFGHDFSAVGVNAAIKTRRWDLIGNGYFPVGVRNYTSEATVGGSFFQGNNIILQQGIDSALTGFDVTLKMRPKQLAFMNGSFEIGGYGYGSDLVNSFGGGRIRVGAQGKRGLIVSAEINHDDRFETTGVLNVGYVFGSVGGRNSEYAGIGRDLEETNRNDHIVRFNQSVELAIDPFTGAAYNVVHVADGAAVDGDGTAENPFDTLADAENGSGEGDIIFVAAGNTLPDGTFVEGILDGGIRLQDRQMLLGEGTEQIIPIQDNRLFRLGEDTGVGATLTNVGGNNVVTLADNNTVRGININASGATNGINGLRSDSGTIESNTVTGAGEIGILLSLSSGDWQINNNTLTGNAIDGLWVRNAVDATSTYTLTGNNASNNGFDGIHFSNFEAAQLLLTDNITSNNGRHGLILTDYLTDGGDIDIVSHTADANAEFGILIERGDGDLNIVNSNVTNNLAGGIRTVSFTNNTAGQNTFVGNFNGGVSTISGNGIAGANLQFDLIGDGLTQDILVTGLSVDNGGRGIFATSSGVNTTMNIDILDMLSISESTADGIRLLADDGGTLNANIINTTTPLQLFNNAQSSGAAIFIAANGDPGEPTSQINTIINNVDIDLPGSTASATGISVSSTGNAVTTTSISNADIEKSLFANIDGFPIINGDVGIDLDFANNGGGDINVVDIENVNTVTDNGITLDVQANTLADVFIESSTVIAASEDAVDPTERASDAPFNGIFGSRGITVRIDGDNFTPETDTLTRLTIVDVEVRDFAGDIFTDIFSAGFFNGVGRAQEGSAIDIATTGDAQLLLDFRNNRILNNGAGFNNDPDNDGVFDEQPVSTTEDPNNLFFADAVRINAFDNSRISTRIVNNLFQDNFERGLTINTYQNATINASVINNAFDNNDRGEDGDNTVPNSDPAVNLDDSGIFDFEAINNAEFSLRAHQNPFGLDNNGDILDADDDDIPDIFFTDGVAPGFANICLDLSNNVFQLSVNIADNATPPGDFQLGLDGATNGFTDNSFQVFGTTPSNFGLCDQLISNDEAFFAGNGFSQAIH